MASIKNNHKKALSLPDGTVLNPGVATNVPKWDEVSQNSIVSAWVDRKVLTVGNADVPAADEKAELQARLDDRGIEYNKSLGVVKLRALLADPEAGEG